jgi:Lar family restriction alleviation protein
MKMSEELKPCPFCGGEAYSTGKTTYYEGHEAWFDDGSRILVSYHCGCKYCGASSKGYLGQQTVELAINAWNTRTKTKSLMVEQIEEIIENILPWEPERNDIMKAAQAVYNALPSESDAYERGKAAGTNVKMQALQDEVRRLQAIINLSQQQTTCAVCGQVKHTPLRRDEMGGYVCLTCIDKHLDKHGVHIKALESVKTLHEETIEEQADEIDTYHMTVECLRKTVNDGITERVGLKLANNKLTKAAQKLLGLMDEVGYQDGEESDRVFPQYEFNELREALAYAKGVRP